MYYRVSKKVRLSGVKIDSDHLQLQTYFKEENKAIQELTYVKDVLLLFLYVQKWVKKEETVESAQ